MAIEFHSSSYAIIDKTAPLQDQVQEENQAGQAYGIMQVHQSSLWYLQQDVVHFRKQTQRDAWRLFKISNNEGVSQEQANEITTWAKSLSTAYQSLDQATTLDQVKSIMSQRLPIPDLCLGMEKWAMSDLRDIRVNYRHNMYQAVQEIQRWNAASSSRQLRGTIRSHTRTNRLFAVFVGRSTNV